MEEVEQEERWNIIIIITTDYWPERHTVYANISLQIDRWDGTEGQEREWDWIDRRSC